MNIARFLSRTTPPPPPPETDFMSGTMGVWQNAKFGGYGANFPARFNCCAKHLWCDYPFRTIASASATTAHNINAVLHFQLVD